MVAAVVLLILIGIFVPYLMSVREQSRRITCSDNLRQIFAGLHTYADQNNQSFPRVVYDPKVRRDGYTDFTGVNADDPFKPGGVEPSDVTASLFLLVRQNLVAPKVFICPSSSDQADDVTNAKSRSNFSSIANLSYSYATPFSSLPGYKFNSDRMRAEFVIMADKNPGVGDDSNVAGPSRNASPLELARANSNNHRQAGQNVLYVTGTVRFQVTPYCGYLNDNIYTVEAAKPSTQPTGIEADGNGLIGKTLGPALPDDSYLVPAEHE